MAYVWSLQPCFPMNRLLNGAEQNSLINHRLLKKLFVVYTFEKEKINFGW